MTPISRALAALLLTICLGGTAACASPPGRVSDAEPSPRSDVDLTTLRLPLEAYMQSDVEEALTERARLLHFQSCMRRFGFDPPMPTEDPSGVTGGGRNAQRYGVVEAREAKTRGYHPPAVEAPAAGSETRELSKTAVRVSMGDKQRHRGQPVPHQGCIGEAQRTIAAGAPRGADPNLAVRVSFDTLEQSQSHRRVKAAFASWSMCMEKLGYHYSSPWKANDDTRFRTENPTKAEIATATADVRCKKQVDLIETWVPVEVAYQKSAIAQRRRPLQRSRAYQQTMLANAHGLLRARGLLTARGTAITVDPLPVERD